MIAHYAKWALFVAAALTLPALLVATAWAAR